MTPGERYAAGILVRVVAPPPQAFVAGLLIDPDTERCFVAAPILKHCRGQHRQQLRRYFARMGWKATLVKRSNNQAAKFGSDDQTNQGET